MVKVAIKSEKLSPFGGIFSIMELFDSNLSSVIDSTLGMRCRLYGYQYSEIIRSLMSVYFCGGSCIEDVTSHLMYHLSLHTTLRTCSADTILRAINFVEGEGLRSGRCRTMVSGSCKTSDFFGQKYGCLSQRSPMFLFSGKGEKYGSSHCISFMK